MIIRHLESDYGEILDLADTVGDVFDDRAPNGESRTSIVRVAYSPLDGRRLRTATRYGSLMPESSARPRKRSIEGSPPARSLFQYTGPTPTTENWSSQGSSVTLGRANKRQKRSGLESLRSEYVSSQEDVRILSQPPKERSSVQVLGSQQDLIWDCKLFFLRRPILLLSY